MAALSGTDAIRVSTEAAEAFTDAYYTALNGARNTLATFYVPATTVNGRPTPHISYNGEQIDSGPDIQHIFENDMPWTHFEPQSVNAHYLKPIAKPSESDGKASKKDLERKLAVTVQVSGYVRLEERLTGPMRGFSDSFLLTPKEDDGIGGGKAKGEQKSWLISSQHFRFVV